MLNFDKKIVRDYTGLLKSSNIEITWAEISSKFLLNYIFYVYYTNPGNELVDYLVRKLTK